MSCNIIYIHLKSSIMNNNLPSSLLKYHNDARISEGSLHVNKEQKKKRQQVIKEPKSRGESVYIYTHKTNRM